MIPYISIYIYIFSQTCSHRQGIESQTDKELTSERISAEKLNDTRLGRFLPGRNNFQYYARDTSYIRNKICLSVRVLVAAKTAHKRPTLRGSRRSLENRVTPG